MIKVLKFGIFQNKGIWLSLYLLIRRFVVLYGIQMKGNLLVRMDLGIINWLYGAIKVIVMFNLLNSFMDIVTEFYIWL